MCTETTASQIGVLRLWRSGNLAFSTHCVLHEFFLPYAADLDNLLHQHGFAPMRWDTGRKGEMSCPSTYRHWRHLKGTSTSAAS